MNLWKQFNELQTGTDLRVATVVSVGDTESTVEDAAGQQYQAIGTDYAAGAKVFVKDGVIISTAPDLTDAGVLYV